MNRIRTVEQLQQMLRNRGEGASYTGIFDWTFQTDFDWLIPYKEVVDNLLRLENGSLQLLKRFWLLKTQKDNTGHITFEDEAGLVNLAEFLRDVMSSHEYELKKLIATLDLEYNPIDNVSEDTLETYVSDGTNQSRENGSNKSAQKNNNTENEIIDSNYGAYKDTINTAYGERTDTSTTTNNNTYGSTGTHSQQSNNVAPMDSDEFHSDTQNIGYGTTDEHTDKLQQTTSTTNGAQNDNSTHSITAHTDTEDHTKDGVSTTSYSSTNMKDITGATTASYSKHILRHGNIGVTSSQELIRQEREIANFSIYERIREIFVENFCMQIYADTDSVAYETGGIYGDYVL